MKATFRYDRHQLDRAALERLLAGDPGSALGDDLDARARRVETRAQQLVGVDTTRLLRSIRREAGRGYVDIVAGRQGQTPYLLPHHDGFPPMTIRPRRAKALRFTIGGRVIFAARVRHPGFAGTKFLARALDAAE